MFSKILRVCRVVALVLCAAVIIAGYLPASAANEIPTQQAVQATKSATVLRQATVAPRMVGVPSNYITKETESSNDGYSYQEAMALRLQVLEEAASHLGTPYVLGGSSPSGFDCSGFAQYVYRQVGYELNRMVSAQMQNGTVVEEDNLQPGDLVFFRNPGSATATHVGIFVGGRTIIHAGNAGIGYASLDTSYFAIRYIGARRIIPVSNALADTSAPTLGLR